MTEGGFKLFGSYAGLFEIANEYNSEVILDAQYRPTSREHQMMYVSCRPLWVDIPSFLLCRSW